MLKRIAHKIKWFPIHWKLVRRGPLTIRYEIDGKRYAAFVIFRLCKPPKTTRFEVVDEVDPRHNPIPWRTNPSNISPRPTEPRKSGSQGAHHRHP